MPGRLTREARLRLISELCPRLGGRRACDSAEIARRIALEILDLPDRPEVTTDYILMRAVDRFVADQLSLEDLYRCRVLAYYVTFASGGEEWSRWGVAATVRPGQVPQLEEMELDDLPPLLPFGPPWQSPPDS